MQTERAHGITRKMGHAYGHRMQNTENIPRLLCRSLVAFSVGLAGTPRDCDEHSVPSGRFLSCGSRAAMAQGAAMRLRAAFLCERFSSERSSHGRHGLHKKWMKDKKRLIIIFIIALESLSIILLTMFIFCWSLFCFMLSIVTLIIFYWLWYWMFFNISYIITLITILIMIKLSILSIMMNLFDSICDYYIDWFIEYLLILYWLCIECY